MSTESYSPSINRTAINSSQTAVSVNYKPEFRDTTIKEYREPSLKRPLNLILSTLMLLLSAPVSFLVALAIKLEDGEPVFYRQKRWGRSGKIFTVFKFRTMVPDADQKFGLKQAE